jgi:hypothetical protein
MALFSRLFGTSGPVEQLNFEIQKNWYVSDPELNQLSDVLSHHPYLRLTKSNDTMDDYDILILSLIGDSVVCDDLDTPPTITFRARKKGMPIIFDQFVLFKSKFFARRGPQPTVRLRFDSNEPASYETSFSTDKTSLFFEPLNIFQKTVTTDKLRLQVITEHGSPVLATFDLAAARPAFEMFSHAILGPEFPEILAVNHEIMDHIMRMGPKYTIAKKKALAALRFPPGPIDYTKGAALYKAAQAYAVARQACEIYGIFPEGPTSTRSPNMPWTHTLYNEALGAYVTRWGR